MFKENVSRVEVAPDEVVKEGPFDNLRATSSAFDQQDSNLLE